MKILETQQLDVHDFFARKIGDNLTQFIGNALSMINTWLPTGVNNVSSLVASDFIRRSLLPTAERIMVANVTMLKVEYDSVDPTGKNPATLTGLVIIPQRSANNAAMTPAMPIIGFQHGTELMREGAPSRFNPDNPLQTIEALIGIILAANSGSIIAMADYQGLGGDDDHIQPYIGAKPLALSSLDLVLATKHYVQELPDIFWSNEVFLTGYSQGGFVTIAAARELESNSKYSSELPLKAVAASGGPHSLSQTMRFLMMREETFEEGGHFIPMAIRGFNAQYGDEYAGGLFTKERAFKPEYQQLWDLVDGHHTAQEVHEVMPAIPRHCLSDELLSHLEDPNSEAFHVLTDNDTLNWQPKVPVHLYHSPHDETVPFENSVKAYDAMKEYSKDVALIPMFAIPLGTLVHIEAYIPIMLSANSWLTTQRKTPKGGLAPGEFLLPGQEVYSEDGNFCLRYQFDGELKQYDMRNMSVQFATEINQGCDNLWSWNRGSCRIPGLAVNQALDGNFAIYSRDTNQRWSSDTAGTEQHNVVLRNDGSLLVENMQGRAIKVLN